MKRINLVVSGVMLVLFVSCASKKTVIHEAKNAPAAEKDVTREMIDWKGSSIGADIPSWVYDAVEEDYAALSKLPQLQKKKIICAEGIGRDLDLLKSWENNFDVQGTFSKSISNYISAKFGGELSGSKDDSISQNFLDELVTTISRAEISGLSKEMDFWVQTRLKDKLKDSFVDRYEYFAVYAIDNADFEYQIAEAIGAVEAKSEAEKEMKTRVLAELAETQIYYDKASK